MLFRKLEVCYFFGSNFPPLLSLLESVENVPFEADLKEEKEEDELLLRCGVNDAASRSVKSDFLIFRVVIISAKQHGHKLVVNLEPGQSWQIEPSSSATDQSGSEQVQTGLSSLDVASNLADDVAAEKFRDDEAEVDVARDVVEFTKVFEPDPRRIKVLPRSWRRHGLFRRPR